MTRRPHHYDPDIGGIRAAQRRAAADRSALDAGSGGSTGGRGCALWLFALAPGLAGLAGWAGGWLLTVVAS